MMNVEDIKVSVVCNAYNHGKYIRDTLEGFVKQKTNFAYEILVHDDASTDNTAEIIKEYEEKYPDIIKPIYQTENQYSKKIPISKTHQYPRARGKYIAICEGDDYWIDPLKLQKQYDILESNSEIDMCAHGVYRVDSETKEVLGTIEPSKKDRVLTTEQVIFGEGGYIGTNSLFFRKELSFDIPKFRQIFAYDYTLQIHGSLRGGIYYIAENLSAYRWLAAGSWTVRVLSDENSEAYKSFVNKKEKMFDQLDIDTNYKYTNVIQARRVCLEFLETEQKGQFKELLSEKYKCLIKILPFKRRLAIKIKARCRFIWEIRNYFRGKKRNEKK